jgi:hypothetical protein
VYDGSFLKFAKIKSKNFKKGAKPRLRAADGGD